MNKLLISLVALASGSFAIADEQIRLIQEELRKRNVYFGEIDGQNSKETTRALRRFQERKGFKVTGEPDADTLAALNLASPEAIAQNGEAPWPDVPVLKSDSARQMKEEDRKYLESLESVGEPPPDKRFTPADEAPDKGVPPAANPQRQEKLPPEQTTPPSKERQPGLPPERAEEFVRKYLDACETNQLSSELAFYSDKVKYFDHGIVDKRFIEKDVAAFYRRWPERSYKLLDVKVLRDQGNAAVVKFRIAFNYRSPAHAVSGQTENVFSIERADDRLRFNAMQEQRVRE